jgi:predicted 3-demethylubiquinone-9 3-methyltransferase (glyoxalase superfamily)
MSQEMTTCLWFDRDAEEAARFYVSVLGGEVTAIARYPEGSTRAGEVLTVAWTMRGQKYLGLNGGPEHPFTPAVSLMVECADQAEIDHYWEQLGAGGAEVACGWLTDRFGLSWQIVPDDIDELFTGEPEAARRAFEAMQKMVKLDVEELRRAAAQQPSAAL